MKDGERGVYKRVGGDFYGILKLRIFFFRSRSPNKIIFLHSFFLLRDCGLLLSQKNSLMFLLIDPQIRILHKILLLLSILILRHGPKIEILILCPRLGLLPFFLFLLTL